MNITIYKIRKRGLKRIYSQIEIQEKTTGILYYSPYVKLVGRRGRPRIIWHDQIEKEFLEQAMCQRSHNFRLAVEYLDEWNFFGHNWIEKDEFYGKIVGNEKNFFSHGFGSWDD